jgi:hypothetical protein
MFYTIYKITNLIDGKIYIGKHQTKNLNDGYMGSGTVIRRAISKYGIENFKKEILFEFDNEAEMVRKEAELVTKEFCLREDTYNLCPGGHGGFGYINNVIYTKEKRISAQNMPERKAIASKCGKKQKGMTKTLEHKLNMSKSHIGKLGTMSGKNHSDETKKKISKANSRLVGSRNSQFGTMWITNSLENKKIKKIDLIPEGWYRGRTINISLH